MMRRDSGVMRLSGNLRETNGRHVSNPVCERGLLAYASDFHAMDPVLLPILAASLSA